MAELSTYPADWSAISVRVRAEAGHRCVRCGHPSDRPGRLVPCDALCRHQAEPIKQRMLTVHHLDMNPANVADWNLAALCQVCHLYVQTVYHVGTNVAMFLITEAWLAPYEFGRLASLGAAGCQEK